MKTFKNYTQPFLAAVLSLSFGLSASALEHRDLMWALHNDGVGAIAVDLLPSQSFRIKKIAGEDLHLLSPVKGRKVKVAILDTGMDVNHPALKNFVFQDKTKCEAYAKFKACLDGTADAAAAPVAAAAKTKKQSAPQKAAAAVDASTDKPQWLQCREKFLVSEENVYPADCFGWSVLDGDLGYNNRVQNTPNNIIGRPDFEDPIGHGTHVAGTIISVTENVELIPVQVSAMGPNQPVKPMSINLSPSETVRNGYNTPDNLSERVARGIIYAINSGAEVINFSLGWQEGQDSEIVRAAIEEAQRRHIIIVGAAGNDSTSAIIRPCQYKGVICVAASRPDGALAAFSNFGAGVDIAAPGVEILSTIPQKFSSIRLPGQGPYDYLSGTSQATPYVTGVIADMLSRGIPAEEIYPRLILGARPVREETPILVGPINSAGVPTLSVSPYKKYIVSGLLDMQRSVEVVKPQPLLLAADKETQIIKWDRKSARLSFQFKLKNYWKDLDNGNVTVQLRSEFPSEIEPAIMAATILENQNATWKQDEERSVKVDLEIRDAKNPALSRMPRELRYQVYVMINGKTHRQFSLKADVMADFNKDLVDPDIATIPLVGKIPDDLRLMPITENYDDQPTVKDYFMIGRDSSDSSSFKIGLMKMNNDHYEVREAQSIVFKSQNDEFDWHQWRPQYAARMDIDGDGQTDYVFGVIEYLNDDLGWGGPWRNHFYIFDQDMHLKREALFDDKRLTLDYNFYWMKVGKSMRPAWVVQGPEIIKKWDILNLMGLDSYDNVPTPLAFRLYYLDEDFKLAHLATPEGYRIVDTVQPTTTQIKAGIVPVLMARNAGTDMKPSYLNTFSVAEVQNGQILNQRQYAQMSMDIPYRNLIDTNKDKSYSLDVGANEFKGAMWSGRDAHQSMRVSLLDLDQGKVYDKVVNSQRTIFDAPMAIRAGFQSKDRHGAFFVTDSEIEYHDLGSDQVSSRSLERYSFFGASILVEVQMPVSLLDRQVPGQKLPALFVPERLGISRGLRVMVPIYNAKGLMSRIVTPARLSFQAGEGCSSLATPQFMGEGSGYAMDYYCGDRIKRLLLKY